MMRMKIDNIIMIGDDNKSTVIHVAAAKALLTLKPNLTLKEQPEANAPFNHVVHEYKEEFPFLQSTKLLAMTRTLVSIKDNMFTSVEISSPISLLGTDETCEDVMNVIHEDMALFKECFVYFYSYYSDVISKSKIEGKNNDND